MEFGNCGFCPWSVFYLYHIPLVHCCLVTDMARYKKKKTWQYRPERKEKKNGKTEKKW